MPHRRGLTRRGSISKSYSWLHSWISLDSFFLLFPEKEEGASRESWNPSGARRAAGIFVVCILFLLSYFARRNDIHIQESE